jgi:glycosyltransferase involved in cell wall biosynthesis
MKVLIVADGRSPITRRWIKMLQPLGYHIDLVSTYPCDPVAGVNETVIVPAAFASFSGSQAGASTSSGMKRGRALISRFRGLAADLRHWLGPWSVKRNTPEFLEFINRIQPDLVHALRIPYEGMLASATPSDIPLVISTWGNDLTYHAPSTRAMADATRSALRRTDGLFSDTARDIRLASTWSFNPSKPSLTVPGNGGIDLEEINRITTGIGLAVPSQVINPRGFRSGSVRNDTFFKSIPLVLKDRPDTRFICPWMAGQPEARAWIEKLDIHANVTLLPMISQPELWREFSRSLVSVSVSVHDGTPNSLLEAMAIGCLPICGNIESIREWITDGENGLLVDPADPAALAEALKRGLSDSGLRQQAAARNHEIIQSRAEVTAVRRQVADFYEKLASPQK